MRKDAYSGSSDPRMTGNNSGPSLRRRAFIGALGAGSLSALSGCTGGDGSGSESNDGSVEESGGSSSGWEHGKSVHFLLPTIQATWWRALTAGHKIVARRNDWDFSFSVPGFDPAAMNDQIVSFAQENDALIVNPNAAGAQVQAIKQAQEEYNTPVAGNKDLVGGRVTHNIQYADKEAARVMTNRAIDHIEEKFGTTEDKTLVHFQGNPDLTGWRRRTNAVKEVMKDHPEMNYVELSTGGTVQGWADAASTYFSSNTADAIVSDSDGSYTRGIFSALAANGQLYYKGHPNHIYITSIDAYPSTTDWIRRGYHDLAMPQTPFPIVMNIAKLFYEQILTDPSVTQDAANLKLEPGTTVNAPDGTYWGEGNPEMEMFEADSGVTMGIAPPEAFGITRKSDALNNKPHFGNLFPAWLSKTQLMDVTFDVQGERPNWSEELLADFQDKLESGFYGETKPFLSDI